jgi:hypothetical protein
MSTTAKRIIVISALGDVDFTDEFAAPENTSSPCSVQILDLASGFNTITVPVGGAFQVTGLTIIPSSLAAAVILTLKGVTGDTGFRISSTAPTSLGISNPATIGITASGAVANMRFIWT